MNSIRDADLNDAEIFANIYLASAGPTYRPFMPETVTKRFTPAWQRSHWTDKLSRARHSYFVAEIQGVPKGFIGIGPAEPDSFDAQPAGEVYSLFVMPDATRNGMGRALLHTAERALAIAGYRQAMLWVFWANRTARTFYERMGWKLASGSRRWDPDLLNRGIKVSDCRYQQSLTNSAI